jgi:hypothetical protein
MVKGDLTVVDGAASGSWIRSRLDAKVGTVTESVPRGYSAYARILHPASDIEGRLVRWETAAEAMGRIAHREMQWHTLIGSNDRTGAPSLGEMDLDELRVLCEILATQTLDPDNCFFGFCDIWAWVDERFPPKQRRQRKLELPMGRNYVVLHGPLATSGGMGDEEVRRSPSLIWPGDHSWFVASEVDFDSTLVGGNAKAIEAIVCSPKLEAWQMEPTDSLAADADKVNGRPSKGDAV